MPIINQECAKRCKVIFPFAYHLTFFAGLLFNYSNKTAQKTIKCVPKQNKVQILFSCFKAQHESESKTNCKKAKKKNVATLRNENFTLYTTS